MGLRAVLELFRSVDRLLSLEAKHGHAIAQIDAEMRELAARVTRLEAREDIVVARAEAAAAAASSLVAMTSVSELSRRLGRLEERGERAQLPPP